MKMPNCPSCGHGGLDIQPYGLKCVFCGWVKYGNTSQSRNRIRELKKLGKKPNKSA